ncbi:putative B3 domain-containing protein At4g03160 [Raphanus sativus]|uniref:B3 domain-containing protein At4g03160 n=1 Tax=Raphanus sativus TaxID=3726 RepID=A0A6J0LVK9_RAPSA|nr:putative B3 domain-containing protein At4g03160 [Raphanus sativus]
MATSTMGAARKRLTPEEVKKREEQDEMVTAAFALTHFMFLRDRIQADDRENHPSKKRKIIKKDDTEETLELLLRWTSDPPKNLPEATMAVLGRCSKPIWKQLTKSDVKKDQNRLMLGKAQVDKNFLPLFEESDTLLGKEGTRVSVYGPDGKVYEMMFKMWNEKKTPVLMSGWNKFVKEYKLSMYCDFLTVLMFMHKETREICVAIDFTRHPIVKQLSERISKIVFKVED